MFSSSVLGLLGVIAVSLLSLLGTVFFLFEEKFLGKILLYLVSFSTGALLGDVFLHIIPELSEEGDLEGALRILLLGLLFSFAIEKIIQWRHCHVLGGEEGHHHHPVGVLSIIGESLHNFIDGVVIAASFIANVRVGISTMLAVVFHEIPHEIGNVAVLLHAGYGKKRAILGNMLSASAAILGAALVLGANMFLQPITAHLLPFAAGNLLYIAGSDLIPELHKNTRLRDGIVQLVAMITGMLFMSALLLLE